jgi:hypothetical protein
VEVDGSFANPHSPFQVYTLPETKAQWLPVCLSFFAYCHYHKRVNPHIYTQPATNVKLTRPKPCNTVAPSDRRPLVISGPSGVGKGTLYNKLFAAHPDTFTLSVSHTTRKPRDGEQDGVHYHFVSMQDFEDLIAKDGFVEHAKFGSNRYGTSKATIEEQTAKGKVVVLDIEMEVSLGERRRSNFGSRTFALHGQPRTRLVQETMLITLYTSHHRE